MGETREQNREERAASVDIDKGLERDLQYALGLLDEDDLQTTTEEAFTPQDEAPPVDAAQSQGEDQPTQEAPEDHDPEIEIGGEKVKLSQIQEWRKGYLRQDDYTRKTQQLAEQRKQIEQLQQRLQPLLAVEQYLAANPQAALALKQVLQSGGVAPQPQAGAVARGRAVIPPKPSTTIRPPQTTGFGVIDPVLEQRLSKLEQFEAEQQLDRALQEVRSTMNNERQSLGLPALSEEEWGQVSNRLMSEALQHRVTDLHQAYRLSSLRDEWYREGLAKAREAALQEQAQKQRQQASAVIGGSPRGVHTPSPQTPTPKDFTESTRAAFQELRQSGKSLLT